MAATAASSAILFTDMFAVSAVDKGASSRLVDSTTLG
jgi:hypothetical protein